MTTLIEGSPNLKSTIPLIYNNKNKYITKSDVEEIINKYLKKKIKIDKDNLKLYQRSLTHKSYTEKAYVVDKNAIIDKKIFLPKQKKYIINVPINELKQKDDEMDLMKKSYEQLEFVGDAILHTICTEYLFKRYPKEDEGFLTKLRSQLENGDQVGKMSQIVGLAPFIIMSKQMENSGGRQMVHVLEDVFEAFLGAMNEEFGLEICREFVINIIEANIDITDLLSNDTNYKERLIKLFHKKKWDSPKYNDVSSNVDDDSGRRIFKVNVIGNNGKKLGSGIGFAKKKAEQAAAYKALVKLGVIEE